MAPRTRPGWERAIAALRAVLPRSAELEPLEVHIEGHDTFAHARLNVNGRSLHLAWIGQPSERALRSILAHSDVQPDVLAGSRLSRSVRELLSASGVGWVDETGAAEIAHGSLIVSRTGQPVVSKAAGRRWNATVEGVAEALLIGTPATTSAVQEATGLSTGSCVNALRFLAEEGLLEASAARGRGSARHLTRPAELLESYAASAAQRRPAFALEVGVVWRDIVDGALAFAHELELRAVHYAVTGSLAAAELAPYLTRVATAEIYVDCKTPAQLVALLADFDLRPVPGGRLLLRPFPSAAVARLSQAAAIGDHPERTRCAPWPRVYVDLLHAGVRGEDAAAHLRETMLDMPGATARLRSESEPGDTREEAAHARGTAAVSRRPRRR